MRRTGVLAMLGLLAGCAGILPPPAPPPDTAVVAANAFGPGADIDPDMRAIAIADQAFADASRTYGRPEAAARAAAAVDYLGGALTTSPRWNNLDGQAKQDMLRARGEVREALGVSPGTGSQAVVDSLLAAASALDVGDSDAAAAKLGAPVFTQPGQETLRKLSNLPYMRDVNVATHEAAADTAVATGMPCQFCSQTN